MPNQTSTVSNHHCSQVHIHLKRSAFSHTSHFRRHRHVCGQFTDARQERNQLIAPLLHCIFTHLSVSRQWLRHVISLCTLLPEGQFGCEI